MQAKLKFGSNPWKLALLLVGFVCLGAGCNGRIVILVTPTPTQPATLLDAAAPAASPPPPAPTPVNTPTGTEENPVVTQTPVSTAELESYLRGTTADTNAARAQARLFQEGLRFYLIVVSASSTGLEGEIYQDLTRRNIRATTGPDEGFDTTRVECHPNCVYVPKAAVNAITAESWVNVLRHEQRHMVQAANNPDLAQAFRPDKEGLFTTYAAFLEVCADDSIYVGEPIYHTSQRMPKLKAALGGENLALLTQACEGDVAAYSGVVRVYEGKMGEGTFAKLFPPYK